MRIIHHITDTDTDDADDKYVTNKRQAIQNENAKVRNKKHKQEQAKKGEGGRTGGAREFGDLSAKLFNR